MKNMLPQKDGEGEVPRWPKCLILWMIDIIWYNFRNCYSSIKHECPAINPCITAVRQTIMRNTAETIMVEESTTYRNSRNTITITIAINKKAHSETEFVVFINISSHLKDKEKGRPSRS